MDVARKISTKLDKILNRLKALNLIHSFQLQINFCEIEENMKIYLKEIDFVLKKCLKKISKPKRAEIRNVISELVKKKNLNKEHVRTIEKNNHTHINANFQDMNNSVDSNENVNKITLNESNCAKSDENETEENTCEFFEKQLENSKKLIDSKKSTDFIGNDDVEHLKTLDIQHSLGNENNFKSSEKLGKPSTDFCKNLSAPNKKINSVKKIKRSIKNKEDNNKRSRKKNGKKKELREKKTNLEPPFTCFCGKIFEKIKSFKKHQSLKHSLNRMPFKCSTCEKKFFERGNLNRHMKSHNNNNNNNRYQCSACSKCFTRSDALKRHFSTMHVGQKQHSCKFCQKKFSLKFNRDVHEKNVHVSLK